jgi:hypothetical protein
MTYWDWLGDEQPTGTDLCMVITKNYVPPGGAYAMFGKWTSAPCAKKNNYICQKEGIIKVSRP